MENAGVIAAYEAQTKAREGQKAKTKGANGAKGAKATTKAPKATTKAPKKLPARCVGAVVPSASPTTPLAKL